MGKECCCTVDNDEGFDYCAVVLCGIQCGTGKCCVSDGDGQCFACVLCECQCDCMFPCAVASSIISCVACCASKALVSYGIPMTKAGLEATYEAAQVVGVIGAAAVGGLLGCFVGGTAFACMSMSMVPCCYMPCYFADNAALIDGTATTTSWSVDCASMALCSLCCCGWVVTSTKRSEMRYALGIKEESKYCPDFLGDECAHFWCMPCALAEERKILEQNGCTRAKPAVDMHAEIMAGKKPEPAVPVETSGSHVEMPLGKAAVTAQPQVVDATFSEDEDSKGRSNRAQSAAVDLEDVYLEKNFST